MPPVDEALPIVLSLAGGDAGRIRRHLEGELGWQPVEVDGPVPPVARLVDVPAAARLPREGPPVWLVVTPDDDPLAAAQAACTLAAAAVVSWPPRDGQLAAAVDALPGRPEGGTEELRIGGAAGGVGCTTVALATAGLVAWSGTPTLVVTHGAVPHPVGGTVDAEVLRAPDLTRAARAVRGVPRLGLVHADGPAPEARVAVDGHAVVRDLGVSPAADLLVVRCDPAGLVAVGQTTAGTVLVADAGPLPFAAFRRAAGGRRLVLLPWSVRVGRAAVLGRVPASLPGSWLRILRGALGARPQGPGGAFPSAARPGLR